MRNNHSIWEYKEEKKKGYGGREKGNGGGSCS